MICLICKSSRSRESKRLLEIILASGRAGAGIEISYPEGIPFSVMYHHVLWVFGCFVLAWDLR